MCHTWTILRTGAKKNRCNDRKPLNSEYCLYFYVYLLIILHFQAFI